MVDFKFVNLCNLSYAKKNGERELNDIAEVTEDDGSSYYWIYLNNSPYYAEVPANIKMLEELKNRTWTLDNKEKNSKLVKSNSETGFDTIYLSDILEKFGYERLDYEVYPNKLSISKITTKEYSKKREEYEKHILK